ncbi:preprotein translocase subunit SecE [Granulicatella seriolae]|jgi:preprotein translocase subunit SecE|uniref:Protein translocase subunit SecE n=1 Tax=Granulicatella seriolae TaxID=2967226 RepID=A0ABT1WP21_9LACT|nr:preprotein translocase subunit SecE [Granulicatella seriolae]
MKFLASVVEEMKLVTWPTGKEVNRYTTTVVATVIVSVIFFAAVDYGIGALVNTLLK